jgi:prepilin-type N-terminal cleavage/methylation domain-containing protein
MKRHAGFTLVEVLVALALTGVVLLMAHRIVSGVVDGAARLTSRRAALDHDANARRLLANLAGSLTVGLTPGDDFYGQADSVTFSTWGNLPTRPAKPWRVTVVVHGGLLLRGYDGSVSLADSVRRLDLDYLLSAGANERWVRVWESPVSAPVAMRMRVAGAERTDTLLLLIGTRG